MPKKILIMGLPDSGKTSLAKLLAPMFNAVLLNEDEVRKEALVSSGHTYAGHFAQVGTALGKLASIQVNQNMGLYFLNL